MKIPRLPALLLAAVLPLATSGCVKKMVLNGTIESTRKASAAFDTLADYELARSAASAGLVQFEGMHHLSPSNEDALYLLIKAWVGYGYAFAEDDMERTDDAGNEAMADYHRVRTRNAYDRSIFYGNEFLEARASGFKAARKDEPTLAKYLEENFTDTEDAAPLFWIGYAWLARVNLDKDNPDLVAQLFVSKVLLERSLALDPAYNHYVATIALAAYHARSITAEVDESKKMFEAAIQKTEGKALAAKLNYAIKYACVKADGALYEKLLKEVIDAKDPDPEQRLTNTVAKRKAQRWLGKGRMMEVCGIESTSPAADAPKAAAPPKGEDPTAQ